MSAQGPPFPERDRADYDVVIVGAGPAGLAAAIRLKQLSLATARPLSVAILEKGSEVGAHILSGAIVDPRALDELLPEWRTRGTPLATPVSEEHFFYFGRRSAYDISWLPMPSYVRNRGNFVGSLGDLCRWMAGEAEALGVEIYPGMAASEAVYGPNGGLAGVVAGVFGIGKDGTPKSGYQPGLALHAKYTLIAEGARGSLAKEMQYRFGLCDGRQPQLFAIGVKELWQVPPERFRPGLVLHGFGWPLEDDVGGGSFLYHFGDRLMAIGLVVHLDYANPFLSPYDEFQRFKTHPHIARHLEGARRLSYGARAIAEGGFQSVPRLAFPGGALIGCAAGFVNVPRIKGSHNAIKTGMMAADAALEAIAAGHQGDVLTAYEIAYEKSWVRDELRRVRNVKPLWSRFGTRLGIVLAGMDMWTTTVTGGWSPFGTLRHQKTDAASTGFAKDHEAVVYPKPDGVLTFDKMSSVYLSNTNHAEDQPPHLRLKNVRIPVDVNLPLYGEPARFYCPAGVFEVVEENGSPRFVINTQNCVHCKVCDIKDPSQNIVWTTPEGGDGPNYRSM